MALSCFRCARAIILTFARSFNSIWIVRSRCSKHSFCMYFAIPFAVCLQPVQPVCVHNLIYDILVNSLIDRSIWLIASSWSAQFSFTSTKMCLLLFYSIISCIQIKEYYKSEFWEKKKPNENTLQSITNR